MSNAIRTIVWTGNTPSIVPVPASAIIDVDALDPAERRAMIDRGEAEWRGTAGGDGEPVLVRVAR